VARREIRERVRGRTFRVVTAILFAGVAAAVVIPAVGTGGSSGPTAVGVVGGSPSLEEQIRSVASTTLLSIRLVDEPSDATARAALSSGRLSLVVRAASSLLVKSPISAGDSSKYAQFVRTLALRLGVEDAFRSAGLTPSQAATVAHARALPVHSLQPARVRTTAEATSLVGVILIFIILTQYLTWTLMGVMEEKANRVVEVLLATVRPMQMLTGKLLGIGTVALAQAAGLVALALILAEAVGSSILHGAAPQVLASTFVWLVLGYALYSWLYAAAGSTAERQDQVQALALPLSAPLILGYVVSLTATAGGGPSLLVEVLAYVPFTSPFAMPVLVGIGAVAWWQFLVSVALSLLATLLVARLATHIYRRAVLRTGGRVRLRELLSGSTI
jgi:ABC-2 type transport system permease protein